ncbi:MAG TPA: hypothetical protein VLS27_20005 [Gammaproteobacteria bacterium]|nr:hypothetical protein [Gammaproteobacteria bacterium]
MSRLTHLIGCLASAIPSCILMVVLTRTRLQGGCNQTVTSHLGGYAYP